MSEKTPDAVVAQRSELVTFLDGLSAQQWNTPSLCEGWRVREVVAHITMPYRYPASRFVLEMVKARGNFNRMSNRRALADARELSETQLLDSLRENVAYPWKPPGGGFDGALSHDVIHGQDIRVALGDTYVVPEDRLSRVLDGLSPENAKYFGADLEGVRLRADDRDWEFGAGAEVHGAAQDLLMVLCGRILPPGHLFGDARMRFTAQAHAG
ncbi:maleylpyruvate isomerase family mycothiol-dependent enzyme [Rhodococcus sp. IEGM 1379]|uniref:maleylpyruvate isomerase family mycothiol-dependent enzyme n=1 Tax=Rhodococcus sp. IEGM 1379 TaxID=3047086 RepID=UPI0024B6DEB5|nr:maleylpyruvate isomerase family mycothiol-dependent enzyme [Rhodococcus sp. IEGM 1379]MDI9917719.1 maleylpyruvate isomerase family mycothiol-dependent enzyme [Rhodococcus sp. IEGM 1379]